MPPSTQAWSRFYEVINSSTAAVAPGDAVSFSQDGTSFVNGSTGSPISRVNDTTFTLAANPSFIYRIGFQVGVANSGQLAINTSTSGMLTDSVVGTSWGHSQIIGDYLFTVASGGTNISIINPSANASSLNLLSHGSGNIDVMVSLIIEWIGS
jgi:hypothetical protein